MSETNYDLKFHHIDEGFCRVVFYHQKPTTGRAWYCLQDEGNNFGGVKMYRCTNDGYYYEPSHEVRFTSKLVLIEPVQGNSDLVNRVNKWIDKYESDFKDSCVDAVKEGDE